MSTMHALAARAADTYRTIDIAGRTAAAGGDPKQLVDLLYEECVRALRSAAHAAEFGKTQVKSERLQRATAILFGLEANLDFERGGEIAQSLASFYVGLRQQVIAASLGDDPAPFRAAADDLADIANAMAANR